jgi:class 3 adenylate cyclase
MAVCPVCAADNREGARFCDACGARLEPDGRAESGQERKTVTVLFTDVTGSTSLGERLDPESLREIMGRFFGLARRAIERHGGTVEKYIGDAVMAVFGVPVAHEDDALRALRAASDLRSSLADFNAELEAAQAVSLMLRTGINTGRVVVGAGSGETFVTGDAVNVAARLQQVAEPGEILLGPLTHRLVRTVVDVTPLGPVLLRGKTEPVAAYQFRSMRATASGPSERRPLVGRTRELARLRDAFAGVVADRRTHLFTLLGPAGVGKSRLVAEFVASATASGEAQVIRGRCLPYGEGLTYWPIAEAVKSLAEIAETDTREAARARLHRLVEDAPNPLVLEQGLAEVTGLEPAGLPPEEVTWAVRTLLEFVADRRPLIVLIDDLQWAEPPLLDLVEHVTDYSRDAPILLLCLARPELLDVRPGWSGGKLNVTTVLLEPLPEAEAELLVDRLLGGSLPVAVRERITTAAEGNPLFAEEFAAMLADDGLIRRDGDRWTVTGDLSSLVIPPSIQAVLAARLDRLPLSERAVAGRASVVGRIFEGPAVVALSPEAERPTVPDRIASLIRKELVRAERQTEARLEAYRFRHLLIRDAAYEALSKLERATLHEQFADWLVEIAGDRIVEYEEIVGHHLRTAHVYRVELGLRDGHTADLARVAASHLGAAGRRAAARDDIPAASTLLAGALELTADPRERIALSIDLADTFVAGGSWQEARDVLDDLIALGITDEGQGARIRLLRARVLFNTDPSSSFEELDSGLEELVAIFERVGDEAYRVKALRTRWYLLFARGRAGEAADMLDEAVAAARAVGSSEWLELARWIPLADAFGPRPVRAAIRRAEILLAEVAGHPAVEAMIALSLGVLRVMDGDEEAGFRSLAEGTTQLDAVGQPVWAGGGLQLTGWARLMTGQFAEAEMILRRSDEQLARLAETGFRSTTAALLGRTLVELDRIDAALPWIDLAESLGATDDIVTHVVSRGARARMAAARGEFELGMDLARSAVALAETGDFSTITADATVGLAVVLGSAGRSDEALAAAHDARRLFEQKGNRPGVAIGDRLISELTLRTTQSAAGVVD